MKHIDYFLLNVFCLTCSIYDPSISEVLELLRLKVKGLDSSITTEEINGRNYYIL